jgi:glycosyltransferase involved in cell wall biosynthesis
MTIGINAMAAFIKPPTGVERYTSQLIKHLTMASEHRFLLYTPYGDMPLPDNFKIKKLRWGLPMWTQVRLSWEMAWRKPDMLFIPVHVLPLVHPLNSVVVIHGLEYEYFPEMYPKKHLMYLRWSTRYALKHASRIIAVSENTKKDLVRLYNGNPEKIFVVHHGVDKPMNRKPCSGKYILYVGRVERKKNIQGLIESFRLLKEKYNIPHQLILAGSPGWDFKKIDVQDVVLTGYISDEKKWSLLKGADCFVFPSFYEGFGLPVLEAQQVGCPVVCANNSSLPEVAGEGALITNDFAEGIYKMISDKEFRYGMIEKGFENVKRFSWEKCAEGTLKVLYESRISP